MKKTCYGVLLSLALALGNVSETQAQYGSQAGMSWTNGSAQSFGLQGSSDAFSNMGIGLARGMVLDPQGRHTSYSYAVRMGDGRVLANSHHLSIDSRGSFYGSARAMGMGGAHAGGRMTGPGTGYTFGSANTSPTIPGWTQSRSFSHP